MASTTLADADAWLPMESNPDIMNKFVKRLGLPASWHFQDIVSLEEDYLKSLMSPRAFLLNYACSNKTDAVDYGSPLCAAKQCQPPCCTKQPFFMQQPTKNSCGAVALIHAIAANAEELGCPPDSFIRQFVSQMRDLSPMERGKRLNSLVDLRVLNNEVAKQGQSAVPDVNAAANLHYLTVVPSGSCVYALDSRHTAPKCVCEMQPAASEMTDEKFTTQVANLVKKLVGAVESTRFSVIALTAAN